MKKISIPLALRSTSPISNLAVFTLRYVYLYPLFFRVSSLFNKKNLPPSAQPQASGQSLRLYYRGGSAFSVTCVCFQHAAMPPFFSARLLWGVGRPAASTSPAAGCSMSTSI